MARTEDRMTDVECEKRIVDLAKQYRQAHLDRDKQGVIRQRILLFMALDVLESLHGRVEPRRSSEESVVARPFDDSGRCETALTG